MRTKRVDHTAPVANGHELARVASDGLLQIERLAAALEQASTVDEIKDVRDRAMAIQLYTRKKKSGLIAAQAAGAVVTNATLMLAELYAEEKAAAPGVKPKEADGPLLVGKQAIAKAADMDPAALSRLAPVVAAPKATVDAAMTAIEARGEIVTPAGLLREIAPRRQLTIEEYSRPDANGLCRACHRVPGSESSEKGPHDICVICGSSTPCSEEAEAFRASFEEPEDEGEDGVNTKIKALAAIRKAIAKLEKVTAEIREERSEHPGRSTYGGWKRRILSNATPIFDAIDKVIAAAEVV